MKCILGCLLQANLTVQAARLTIANNELSTAQAILDEKQRELDEVQAKFDAAMKEKQVSVLRLPIIDDYSSGSDNTCHQW